jgi:hypothetical protein
MEVKQLLQQFSNSLPYSILELLKEGNLQKGQ